MKTKTYQLTNNMKMVTNQSSKNSKWSWLRVITSQVRIRLQIHSVLRMMYMR